MSKAEYYFSTSLNPAQLPNGSLPQRKQVHGVDIVEVTHAGQECGEVDGLWTRTPGQPIAITTADCVPIVLINETRGAVAVLHAGWRGTFKKIVHAFFAAIPREFAVASEWKAVLGPSIRTCCYEVSPELIAQFKAEFSELDHVVVEPSYRKLDLNAVNIAQLTTVGILPENITVHPDCTFCNKDESSAFKYFSYRRGDRMSRQLTVVKIIS